MQQVSEAIADPMTNGAPHAAQLVRPAPADEHRIDQVVVNLVNNVVKYAPESKNIFLSAEKVGQNVKISVRDTGPGIAPDKIPHLFERFARGRKWQTIFGFGFIYFCRDNPQTRRDAR